MLIWWAILRSGGFSTLNLRKVSTTLVRWAFFQIVLVLTTFNADYAMRNKTIAFCRVTINRLPVSFTRTRIIINLLMVE